MNTDQNAQHLTFNAQRSSDPTETVKPAAGPAVPPYPRGRGNFGKVARCPAGIREELNWRMLDGAKTRELLDWLNAQPEVQRLVKEDFEGKKIEKENLSRWRNGGYKEWREEVKIDRLATHALALGAKGNGMAQGCAARIAARILVTLSPVDSVTVDGETVDGARELSIKELGELTKMVVHLRKIELEPRKLAQKDRWTELKERELALKADAATRRKGDTETMDGESVDGETVDDDTTGWEPVVGENGELRAGPKMEALREAFFGKEDAFGTIPWIEGESQGPRLPPGYVYTPTGWVPGDSPQAKAYAELLAAAGEGGKEKGEGINQVGDAGMGGSGDAGSSNQTAAGPAVPPYPQTVTGCGEVALSCGERAQGGAPQSAQAEKSVVSDQLSAPSQSEQTVTQGGAETVTEPPSAAEGCGGLVTSAATGQQAAPGQSEQAREKTPEEIEYERKMEEQDRRVRAKEEAFRKQCAERDPFKEFRRGYVPPPPRVCRW